MWLRRLILISDNRKEMVKLWLGAVLILVSIVSIFKFKKLVVKPVEVISPMYQVEQLGVVSTVTPVDKRQLKRVLIIGDSMIVEGFGPRLENDLSAYHLEVKRRGKYSTGLNRTDVFDWNKYSLEIIEEDKPEALIVMFGANDSQNILDDQNRPYRVNDLGWDEIYTQRVAEYMALISPRVEKIYWVGQPPAREAVFSGRLKHLDEIYKSEAKKWSNIKFISTWERFTTAEGKYQAVVADDGGLRQRVKTDDGIHLTYHGSKIMSQLVIGVLKQDFELE